MDSNPSQNYLKSCKFYPSPKFCPKLYCHNAVRLSTRWCRQDYSWCVGPLYGELGWDCIRVRDLLDLLSRSQVSGSSVSVCKSYVVRVTWISSDCLSLAQPI